MSTILVAERYDSKRSAACQRCLDESVERWVRMSMQLGVRIDGIERLVVPGIEMRWDAALNLLPPATHHDPVGWEREVAERVADAVWQLPFDTWLLCGRKTASAFGKVTSRMEYLEPLTIDGRTIVVLPKPSPRGLHVQKSQGVHQAVFLVPGQGQQRSL